MKSSHFLSVRLFLLHFLLIASVSNASLPSSECISTGDEAEINRILYHGGKGTKVALCQRSLFRLKSPIIFTAEDQALYTEGYPKDANRAMLIVEGPEQSMAIQGDCIDCNGVSVSSLIIDGNRPLLLRVPMGGALVELGNANDQQVVNCKLYEPRGWSALHLREGDWKSCSRAHIQGNEIGPCGEEWDPAYDGLSEKSPPFGNPRSDGISLACMDSVVEDNVVYDTTDGAIVIFGSRGSTVQNNVIYSRTRTVLGGINLVDVPPWEGDYTSVLVTQNHIFAHSAYLKVALNIGPATWSDDTESLVHHGSVIGNTISGTHLGYGIVVASCTNFTVLDNIVQKGSRFVGVMGAHCPEAPKNADPRGFVINKGSSEGVFQEEFENGEVQHIICIEPVVGPGEDGRPRRLRDSPLAIAARAQAALEAAEDTPPVSTGEVDEGVAEAIVTYQMALLKEVQGLEEQLGDLIDTKPSKAEKKRIGKEKNKGPFAAALMDLSTRLANLESERRQLRTTFEGFKEDLIGYNARFFTYESKHSSLLQRILSAARSISSTPLSSSSSSSPPVQLIKNSPILPPVEDESTSSSLTKWLLGFLILQLAILGLSWGWKQWRRKKGTTFRGNRKRSSSHALRMY